LLSIQILPVAVLIVSTARRAEMPVSVFAISGEIIMLGAAKCVTIEGLAASPANCAGGLSTERPPVTAPAKVHWFQGLHAVTFW
jgi:hypothetical protein